MTAIAGLRGPTQPEVDPAFGDIEWYADPEPLAESLRRDPGRIEWILIATDVADPDLALRTLRKADSGVTLCLLGDRSSARARIPATPGPLEEALSALRNEREYVRSLLDGVDTVFVLVALDGTIREWNRSAEALSGVPREDALGRSYLELAREADWGRVRADIARLAAGGKPTEHFETVSPTPEGDRHWVWNARRVEDEHGEPAILATGIDLTDQKQAEQALRESQRRALEAQKLAAITALTGGIAHDIGTPMTAILGYAELLAKSVTDEKNQKRATTIVEQVHRVSDLIETLLNLSRMEDRSPQPVELARVADKALDFYREKFKRHDIQIERSYGAAPRAIGDSDRLHQVLLSLFLSALEWMPAGGSLRIGIASPDPSEVEVRVSHSGPANDPDPRAPIFAPDRVSSPGATGTNLGLLVARTIVEEHGGRIRLEALPAGGSEFRICLPAMAEPARLASE